MIMHGAGTVEAWIEELGQITIQYRKPLRLDEVAQMAQTQPVRERPGRP